MAHNIDPNPGPDNTPQPMKRPKSTWIVIGVLAVLLVLFAFQGAVGIAVWFFLTGLFLLLTALYALAFRRRTWASLLTAKQRRVVLAGSAVTMILGVIAGAIAAPRQQPTADNEQETRPSDSSSPSDSPTSSPPSTPPSTPSSSEAPLANQPCTIVEQTRRQGDVEYRCTQHENGQLVWLDKETSERVTEARKAAEARAAEERAAAEKAAAEEQQRAEQERRAAQEEADRLAAEQAAEAERQRQADAEAQRQAEVERQRQAEEERRLAEEQATQQSTPPAEPFYYANCTAVQEAGAAPIHRGDYGWHPDLDRDNDGVACGGD